MLRNKTSEHRMLTPKHSAEVTVVNAGKGFSPEKTMEELMGKPTFYLTKYIILREKEGQLKSDERVSVIKVRTEGRNLLKTIVRGEVLAHPDKCVAIVDPTIDEFVLNQLVLKAASVRTNEEAIILSDRNENVTFVCFGEQDLKLPLKIMLIDTIPPRPSRLETLTRTARASGLISEHINFESLNVDASEMVRETLKEGKTVFTPCPIGEPLNPDQSITSFRAIAERAKNEKSSLSIDFVGCSLSLMTLNKLKKTMGLNLKVSLRDICPLHAAREASRRADMQGLIARCCKIMESPRIIHMSGKPLIILPWAPSLVELVKAIDDLVSLTTKLDVD